MAASKQAQARQWALDITDQVIFFLLYSQVPFLQDEELSHLCPNFNGLPHFKGTETVKVLERF